VEASAVVRFGAILAVVTLVTIALLVPVFGWLRSHEAGQDPPPPPMGRQPPGARQAPEPRLQLSPPQDLRAAQREAERRLTSYGWVVEDKRIVHIPIDDAMRLLAQRAGAPSPPASPAAAPSPAAKPERKP
jgi:hypothetical protein